MSGISYPGHFDVFSFQSFQVHMRKGYDTIHYICQERQDDRMSNRDWEQFGNDILKTVQEAIESCNYDKLNQNVGDAVNQVVDSVTKNVKHMADTMNQKTVNKAGGAPYDTPQYGQKNAADIQKANKQRPDFLLKRKELIRMPSKAGGILLSVFGFAGAAFCILLSIVALFASIVAGKLALPIMSLYTIIIVALILCLSIGFWGSSMTGRINRFKRYVKEVGQAEFCKISDMAKRIRKDEKYVIKDLEKMIKKGWFVEGHLDKQKTCLIVTNQMYEQYQQLEQRSEVQRIEAEKKRQQSENEQRKAQEAQELYRKTLSPEVQKVIEQGDAYVKKIRECNDAIPGVEISAKIDRMEMIVDKIFDRVEQNPQSVKDIRKLMEYYLPTTVKLLEAYAEMDAQPVGGENIETAKKEIEATLDTLNSAFEKLLDSLFQKKAWDVSSDISVLNTMLAQEGLKEDGLKKSV